MFNSLDSSYVVLSIYRQFPIDASITKSKKQPPAIDRAWSVDINAMISIYDTVRKMTFNAVRRK